MFIGREQCQLQSCKFDFQGVKCFISKHQTFELMEVDIYCPHFQRKLFHEHNFNK